MQHRILFSTFSVFLLVALILYAGHCFAPVAHAAEDSQTMEAAPPEWLEQKQNAASFTYDWLVALDNEEYAQAAASYTVDGDTAASESFLRAQRKGLGELSSRSYEWATVTAVATDDSEHKVQVVYTTEFAQKTVTETIEVLLWHKDPIVLSYTIVEK